MGPLYRWARFQHCFSAIGAVDNGFGMAILAQLGRSDSQIQRENMGFLTVRRVGLSRIAAPSDVVRAEKHHLHRD